MPAKNVSVNLLAQDEFSRSAVGKVLLWALSIGRYIVVFTELIVILSFLSRFKLDRDLTDLNESIARQKNIIQSYGDLEPKFRHTQAQLALMREQQTPILPGVVLDILGRVQPPDVRLEKLSIQNDRFTLSAVALSPQGFTQFIRSLSAQSQVDNVTLGSITSADEGLTVEFEMEALLNTQL